MIAVADNGSRLPDVPTWLLTVAALTLLGVAIWALVKAARDAAAASVPAPVQRRAFNPECSQRGHVKVWFGENVAWICGRDGCSETWPVPDRPVYDQVVGA